MTAAPRSAQGPLRLAVVGGGWAGLSCSVHAVAQGHRVTLFEMSRHWGGRARALPDLEFDNGQHILIGAYRSTLALMRLVGVDVDRALMRAPLALTTPDGSGLVLRPGPAAPAFVGAVLRCATWSRADRWRLLAACARWAAAGFRCEPDRSVAELCRSLPPSVTGLLIDPLCVAALNTPAAKASAAVFLRVLRDGLFGGPGASDLLLPRQLLHELLPRPAERWLTGHGAELVLGHRVGALHPDGTCWRLDGRRFDAVVLACPSREAARLARPLAPDWAEQADALSFEPIITVYVRCAGAMLPAAMVSLPAGARSPAQFVFDHGVISGRPGLFAFVVSGAASWIALGLEALGTAVLDQAQASLTAGPQTWHRARVERIVAERRATFSCLPALRRPSRSIAPRLVAAGDYVEGPYPATIEGAVRSGQSAVAALGSGGR